MNTANKNAAQEMDAIDLLTSDHHEVAKLFKQYKKMTHQNADVEQRQELAGKICQALSVHAQIEEEIFYPALRRVLDESDLLDEAEVEHASIKNLIEQIASSTPDKPLYDAKIITLSEYVKHHVEEEEGEIFKKARKAKVDIDELGMKLSVRKAELMEDQASGKKSTTKPNASGASHKKTTEHVRA